MKQVSAILLSALLLAAILPMPVRAAAGTLSAQDLMAEAAVLMDADTGQVLFEKSMSRRMYPASTTKIMTGLLVMENCGTGEIVTTNESAVDPIPRNTSHIWLDYAEQLPVDDAMYALMLPSANDAANALAEHVAGSQQRFADMMNARAQELGAVDTHFTNAHGLHDDDHYTTPYDLALITRAAYENGEILRYMGTAHYDMPPTNKQADVRHLHNQCYMVVPEQSWAYNTDVLGGKVGFTDEARHTMSTVAQKNGRTLIAVVMQTGTDEKFYDTQKLFDYGFDCFSDYTMPGERLTGEVDNIAYSSDDVQMLLPRSVNAEAVEVDIQIEDDGASAVLRLDTGIDGLPSELMSVPLQVEEQDAVRTSALLGLEPKEQVSFWGVARRVVSVILWLLCILTVLLILLVIRRTMVIRKRKRQRAARMRRLRGTQ